LGFGGDAPRGLQVDEHQVIAMQGEIEAPTGREGMPSEEVLGERF
jgi:hypothetical protein